MIHISLSNRLYQKQKARFKRLKHGALELHLDGWARLEHEGDEVPLRKKGVALLCYLALEGPTERDFLTDLLWDSGAGSSNLRVELHRLRQALRGVPIDLFKERQDPLRLSRNLIIHLPKERAEHLEILRGLDDVSPQYQAWLEVKRTQFSAPQTLSVREMLVDDVAKRLSFPFLLILQGQPEAGQPAFAQALAKHLRLPFITGEHGSARAVRYVRTPPENYQGLLKRILEDRESVWVIERSAFGEDTPFLLELRGYYPAHRTQFVKLPNLSWQDARESLLSDLSFDEAARLYCATEGHLGYLSELLSLRPDGGFSDHVPLPQRIRAAYHLEARRLSRESRYALERLSVHPGSIDHCLLEAFGAKPYLDELERHGWLIFDTQWRFADNIVRTVLYDSLPEGQRVRYHQTAAHALKIEEHHFGYAYHCQQVNGKRVDNAILAHTTPWEKTIFNLVGAAPILTRYGVGKECAILEAEVHGPAVVAEDGRITLIRTTLQAGRSHVTFEISGAAQLFRLCGNVFVNHPMKVGVAGNAPPLRLTIGGQCIIFADVPFPLQVEDGSLLIPLANTLDFWFYSALSDATHVTVASAATNAVLDLRLTAYALNPSSTRKVEGFALGVYPRSSGSKLKCA